MNNNDTTTTYSVLPLVIIGIIFGLFYMITLPTLAGKISGAVLYIAGILFANSRN